MTTEESATDVIEIDMNQAAGMKESMIAIVTTAEIVTVIVTESATATEKVTGAERAAGTATATTSVKVAGGISRLSLLPQGLRMYLPLLTVNLPRMLHHLYPVPLRRTREMKTGHTRRSARNQEERMLEPPRESSVLPCNRLTPGTLLC